jgi:hypothetical protein
MSESLTALGGLPDPITVPLFRTTPDDALPDSGGHFAPAALRTCAAGSCPGTSVWRIWRAWHSATPAEELLWLLDLVGAGYSLHLYLRL